MNDSLSDKEVLYLESDEEITTAIDKMTALEADKVSIVVPKRSTLLQSIVNLKLLKKAAADSNKELVLVTADRTATALAGQLGLAVASTLKSTPAIPVPSAAAPTISEDIVEGDESPIEKAAMAASASVTGVAPTTTAKPKSIKPSFAKPVTVRQLSDSPDDPVKKDLAATRVPNFNALQKRLLIGGSALVAIALLMFANFWFSSAHIILYAKGTAVQADFNFAVDTTIKDSDPQNAVLTGQKLELIKEHTGSFVPTGKKDIGTKARGTMTVTNKTNAERTLVAGTRFQSGDKIFKSDSEVVVPAAHLGPFFNPIAGTATVPVTADLAGDQYNLAPARYTIPALSSTDQTFIYGDGNQMAGGTTKQVLVVTAADIEKAKADILEQQKEPMRKELESKSAAGYKAIPESFIQTPSSAVSNPAIDTEATQATLTLSVSYSELAVNEKDFKSMVLAAEQKLVGQQNQIYDDGLSEAKLTVGKTGPGSSQNFAFSTEAYAGAKLDSDAITKQLAGMRYGDAVGVLSKLPGVERSEINLSPTWSSKLPRVTSHIKIDIKVAAKG